MIPYYSPLRETNAHGTGMVRERDMRKSMAVMIAATADTLATKSFVAKSAFAMAGPGNRFDYAIAGDSLVLTQKPQGTVIKFARVE